MGWPKGKKKTPEQREATIRAMKRNLEDPDFLAKRGAAIKAALRDPSWRAEQSQRVSKNWQDPNTRENIMAGQKRGYLKTENRVKRANGLAKYLRDNPSGPEVKLHAILDALGIDYEVQHVIGWYVCDVYLPEDEVVIEVHGDYWHSLDRVKERDAEKISFLEKEGYKVICIKGTEVHMNLVSRLLEDV